MEKKAKIIVGVAIAVVVICCGGGGIFSWVLFKSGTEKITLARNWVGTSLTTISQDWSKAKAEPFFEAGALDAALAEALRKSGSALGAFKTLGTTSKMGVFNKNGDLTIDLGLRSVFEKGPADIECTLVLVGEDHKFRTLKLTPK